MVNKVILVGRLGADPELKTTASGTDVCEISLATREAWKRDGTDHVRTEWHKVVLWDQRARFTGEYLHKGDLVYVEGSIRTERWEDKEGNARYTTKVKGWTIQSLTRARSTANEADAASVETAEHAGVEEDDLPF